jgi:hypothetical protein
MNVERDPAGASERAADSGEDAPEQAPPVEPSAEPSAPEHDETVAHPSDPRNMLPQRERRRTRAERLLVRLVATGGIVGIGVAIAAIMVASNSRGWLVGLVVSIVSVVLAAILWSSRQV